MQGTKVENRLFSVNSIAFLEAAQAGNLEKLRALHEAGAYIHALRFYDQRNALDLAARAGLACIRFARRARPTF